MTNMFNEDGTYNKTNWKTGDKITADKLNKIEVSLEAINNNDISRHAEVDTRLDALEEGKESYETEVNDALDAMEDRVQDNINAVNLEIYQVKSDMTFLEQELNEGITEVNNIADTVDDKVTAAEMNIQNYINQGKVDMEAMVAEVEDELEGLHAKDDELNAQLERIENKKLDNSGGVISRQLFGNKNNATLFCKSNTKNAYAPVTPDTLEAIAEYKGVDQSLDCNVFWTDDDNGKYVGTKVSVISTTSNAAILSDTLSDDFEKGSLVALYTDIPTINNIAYIGELQSIEDNIINVDRWVSTTSYQEEVPWAITYAVVGIATKMYVNYNYVRARSGNEWLTSIVGDQMEMRNSSYASLVAYYASLRHDENKRGGVAFRAGTQGDIEWTSAYDLNGKAKYLISMQTGSTVNAILYANGEVLIDGDGSIGRAWSNSSAAEPTPILNLDKNTDLTEIQYDKNAVITIRNNTNGAITLTASGGNIYTNGTRTDSFILKGYSCVNATTNGIGGYWINGTGDIIKSATFTSTTGTNGNISVSAAYKDNIVLSAESLNYIVLIRKISDRYTICVYEPSSTGLTPVKDTEITYTIYYI